MTIMNAELTMPQAISTVSGGQNLTVEQARSVMRLIMSGEATPSQISGLLIGLRMKGETVEEITGFAEAMRSFAGQVKTENRDLLDTCGTGGSGIHKFNISTTSAIIAAAAGARVAKHGNRAMSGKSGSADVLEALGVGIGLTAEQAAECLTRTGICFMFAQLYHPALKHAAVPRKELGVRTIFNLLGPLANPANADRQMMGLYDRSRTETVAKVLGNLGLKRALVVGSHDGLDEISISAPTRISELKDGVVSTYDIAPEDLGLTTLPLGEVKGGNAAENAAIIHRVLGGERSAYRDIVLANAGACLYVADRAGSLREGVELAAGTIDSGKALDKLKQWIATTGEMSHVS
ncbi:anthranilate phosphoribosyltransferase [Cohnella thailandensis]|uniref:Anthranilate phosphoribosyltransferase n=2 Tax=Cohnella thailandensis TaxID=557557 RepID=A0A841SWQ4_9BACL|nr:anthranilate phosphoribosyltransferase [Cohnella thailandensis]MBB6635379.1 anthranilate phosphoribosyltransferase [Cohnella thailandensis]MBP1974759.1 anthranilate phosphoribosyltransferase [Cohnella thailandensis]